MRVTIVGAGNMAGGIGTRVLAGGNRLRVAAPDRADADALADTLRARVPGADVAGTAADDVDDADVVVLAVPFDAAKQVVAGLGARLAGKIVVDISNPVNFSTFDSLVVPPDSSAAEQVQAAAASGVRVVKAFNTTFAGTLVDGEVAGMPLDVFIAGDDEDAKTAVAELVRAGGMNPVDVGRLAHARELEGFQLLNMASQTRPEGHHWMSAIKIVAPTP